MQGQTKLWIEKLTVKRKPKKQKEIIPTLLEPKGKKEASETDSTGPTGPPSRDIVPSAEGDKDVVKILVAETRSASSYSPVRHPVLAKRAVESLLGSREILEPFSKRAH